MKRRILIALIALVSISGVVVEAQWGGGRRRGRRGAAASGNDTVAPTQSERNGVPEWEVEPAFKSDVFTFVRIRYNSRYRDGAWWTDAPDSDLNFSFRLQQLTSLKVNPQGRILELTDPELFDYPFIYMLEVNDLEFSDEEVECLRRYLLNGGFLMVDDSWDWSGAWANFEPQMRHVFPKIEPVDLPIEHEIFHCVYDMKEKPQVPGIDWARYNGHGSSSERGSGPPHYRAWFDSKGRMMAIICQNTDLGDGWEREGEEEWYFHQYSEKQAYPMGINIVFYAMTH